MRTKEEILARFKTADDMFGTQAGDLIQFLEFQDAKEHLNEEFVKKVEQGEEKWIPLTDPKKEILNYLEFAYDKAESRRGLSAQRSLLHFMTWIWLDDPKFYDEIIEELENYTNYGIPALDKISKHYGYVKN